MKSVVLKKNNKLEFKTVPNPKIKKDNCLKVILKP